MLDTAASPADSAPGATWTRKDLLDTDTLTRAEIDLVLETARGMREVRSRPVSKVSTLRGVTVATLFYEQSTRTRASFEVAAKALGADVVNLTASGSSVEKGETLIDTVRTLEAIGADIIVMRHSRSGAPYLAARHTAASIVNGGDGTHAHPTQALLDLYTMVERLGSLEGRKVVIVGDVLHSRVARSNAWTLLRYGADVVFCGPATLLPRSFVPSVDGRACSISTDLDSAIEGADVVMALRMQKERQQRGLIPSIREYIANYQINAARLARARQGALLMHPGPMNEGIEVSPDVAHGAQSLVEEQVANGVAVRMALLYLIAARSRT
ncbi:MAG: aspartate carbamoyltransferase [Tepidiforma sp.]|nr:MAG: aspartate carbamoyltransferase [Tepidiforma sp.]